MKKIFLLLVSAALISTSFAQYNDNDRDVVVNTASVNTVESYGSYGYAGKTYVFTMKEKNLQIMKINYYYDEMVQSVKDMNVGSAEVKDKKIDQLEAQRVDKLHIVSAKFFSRQNAFGYKKKFANDIYYNNRYNWNL